MCGTKLPPVTNVWLCDYRAGETPPGCNRAGYAIRLWRGDDVRRGDLCIHHRMCGCRDPKPIFLLKADERGFLPVRTKHTVGR